MRRWFSIALALLLLLSAQPTAAQVYDLSFPRLKVAEGDAVRAGQVLCIVEAMKMENEITAHRDGVVRNIAAKAGEPVKTGQVLCLVVSGDEE